MGRGTSWVGAAFEGLTALLGVLLLTWLAAPPAGHASTQAERSDLEVEVIPLDQLGPEPQDAQGCNGQVCIRVEGTGLVVDSWETWFDAPAATCTQANFIQDDTVINHSAPTCSDGPARFRVTWNNPGSYPHGTQLCNTWANAIGKPCITIQL
ncbi:MAG: hypothetical protein LC679_16820 [Intrasporangiaceae bacterium]|nr:hypothetical protein [Intrasporangiaceae bacterium]